MVAVGSTCCAFNGSVQEAVLVLTICATVRVSLSKVKVASVLMMVLVEVFGVTVVEGWTVTAGLVTVTGGSTVIAVFVVVDVAITTGVVVEDSVTVGVKVVVCCGPTLRLKSRSYAMGSPFPLLLMIRIDQSPETN